MEIKVMADLGGHEIPIGTIVEALPRPDGHKDEVVAYYGVDSSVRYLTKGEYIVVADLGDSSEHPMSDAKKSLRDLVGQDIVSITFANKQEVKKEPIILPDSVCHFNLESVQPGNGDSRIFTAPFKGELTNILFSASGDGKYMIEINNGKLATLFSDIRNTKGTRNAHYAFPIRIDYGDKVKFTFQNQDRLAQDMYLSFSLHEELK